MMHDIIKGLLMYVIFLFIFTGLNMLNEHYILKTIFNLCLYVFRYVTNNFAFFEIV